MESCGNGPGLWSGSSGGGAVLRQRPRTVVGEQRRRQKAMGTAVRKAGDSAISCKSTPRPG